MYKIIIYSEDLFNRIGVSYSIFWEKYGFTVIDNASNEQRLIQLIKSESPDLIIADYDTINGDKKLFFNRLKSLKHNVEIIVFGMEISNNKINKLIKEDIILDYISRKSFNINDLIKKVSQYEKIITRKAQSRYKDNKISKDIILAAQSQILKELLYGRRKSNELNDEFLKRFNISFPYKNFVVMMTKIHDIKNLSNSKTHVRFFQEIIEDGGIVYICNSNIDELSFIYNFRSENKMQQQFMIESMGKKVINIIQKFYEVSHSVYISNCFYKAAQIKDAYIQCNNVYKMNRNVDTYPLVFCEKLEKYLTNESKIILETYLDKLDEGLKEKDITKTKENIENLINGLQKTKYIELSQLKYLISAFIYIIKDFISKAEELDETREKEIINYNIIEKIENKNDFIEYIQHIGDKLIKIIENIQKSNVYIEKIKKYIKEHYMEEVDMREIAENIGLTTSYMSTMFKKITGQTYKDYLISYRLLKAKEMLSKTTMQIGEISEKVGYENSHYFSKIFKQKVGMTPSEFRNKNYL